MASCAIPLLYLIDFLNEFSGTERHLYEVLKYIDREKFKPFVITFQGTAAFKERVERLGVPMRILGMSRIYGKRQLKELFVIKEFVKQQKIKIIQTFHTNPDIYGTVLAKLSGIPVVISSRRDLGLGRNRRNVWCYKLLDRYVDHIICASGAVKRFVIDEEGVDANKTSVIYNGIETTKLDAAIAAEREKGIMGLELSCPVIGMLANFNPVKGHRYFIEAAALIRKELPQARFVLAGNGPAEEEMKRKARLEGLDGILHFLGHRQDIANVLSVMDIVVAPSLSEGFSNTILEALYMRKAVIATAVGGNPEVITHNKTGMLVRPAQSGDIAHAAVTLLNNPALRSSLKENGRKLVEERFLINGMMRSMTALYEGLLAGKSVRKTGKELVKA